MSIRVLVGRPLKSQESNRQNWARINSVENSAAAAANEASQLRYRIGRPPFHSREDFFPFKIYRIPSAVRQSAPKTTDWRTFIVRSGQVMETPATGTDGVSDPYSELYPTSLDNEVIVPEEMEKFWFWLEIGQTTEGVTTATVRYSDNPTAESFESEDYEDNSWSSDSPWTSFPRPDSGHIPIGYVDTNTKRAERRPLIRQFLVQDLILIGSDCF